MERASSFCLWTMIILDSITYKENYIIAVVSTGESIPLPVESLKIYALSKGKVIDPVEYRELKEESDRFSCRRKALHYLSIRARSSREMENYLLKKGFSKDHIREVVLHLKENGYIDDLDFSLRYISYRKSSKAVGRHLLKSELYKKGIAREIINKAMAETGSPETDREAAYQLAVKKVHTIAKSKNRMGKLVLFLRRRGFDEADIRGVIIRLKSEGLFTREDEQEQ